MSRRLILILNDGGRANHLPGVAVDARNYLDFFHLPEAGLWQDEEIRVYQNNCTIDVLRTYIFQERMRGLNHCVVVFCGHGYVNEYGVTCFEVSPGHDISLIDMRHIMREVRCLMIADSCRVLYLAEGGRVPEVRMFAADDSSDEYKQECLRLYEEDFRRLPRGHFSIGMAASNGQSARESDVGGGLYSKSLLISAREVIDNKKSSVHHPEVYNSVEKFPLVHAMARLRVQQITNGEQVPECDVPQGMQAPFVVVPM